MGRLLTIILNWRTPEMTLRAAEAARIAMARTGGEIVIVDNDSGDGSFDILRKAVADRRWGEGIPVRVLQSGRNGGFGAGNNFGMAAGMADGGKPDFVYILNSDAFPAPHAIALLLEHLRAHPETGLAGSYIHGLDGTPHCTAFRFHSIAGEFEGAAATGPFTRLLRRHVVPLGIPQATRRVDWLAGASLMIRSEVLDRIGGFDEAFFLYFEETDLCLRAARAGWATDYVRDSHVAHVGSASTGMGEWQRTPGYWFDSRLHFFAKNYGVGYAALATAAHVAGGLIYRLRCLLLRNPRRDPPHFLRDLVRHDVAALLRGAPTPASLKPDLTTPTPMLRREPK